MFPEHVFNIIDLYTACSNRGCLFYLSPPAGQQEVTKRYISSKNNSPVYV